MFTPAESRSHVLMALISVKKYFFARLSIPPKEKLNGFSVAQSEENATWLGGRENTQH